MLQDNDELLSPRDIILQDADTPMDEILGHSGSVIQPGTDGSALYDYRENGRVNGIQVAPQDRNLPIAREEELRACFEVKYKAKVWTGSLSRDEGRMEYERIHQLVLDGGAVLISEQIQFSQASSEFLAIVRYDETEMRLSSRYNYIKENSK